MTGIMGKWPSGHGQPTKIRPPDSCGGETITTAAQFGYDRHGFEGYLGNVVNGYPLHSRTPHFLGWVAGDDDLMIRRRSDSHGLLGEPVEEQSPSL